MKWPWTETDRDPASGECQHSWGNWGTPETMEMGQSYGIISLGGEMPRASVSAITQTRKCLKCNLHQCARIS